MPLIYFDDFLKNALLPIYGITLLLSLYRYPKYFESKLKFLPILFIYTLLNEFLGYLINYYQEFSIIPNTLYEDYNWLIYNLYIVIFYLYFYYIFRSYVESSREKTNIFYGGVFFLFVCTINAFLEDFSKVPQVYSYVSGGLVLIYCITLYFKKFFSIPGVFKSKEDILFWLSSGLMLFYVCYLPIKVIRYIHTTQGTTPEPIVKRTHLLLILISYTFFIIGFLRMKKRYIK